MTNTTTSAQTATLDANEAVASVAYRYSETVAIYPITPSSPMAEWCDESQARDKPNLWGTVPDVVEMQSEAGAAGAVHGALQMGALTTTFTASQGLLLMIPNMYKIAGELLPMCMHVTARTLATHALSIFGDHSDVMACRQVGFGMIFGNSVQEAQDFAAIGHTAALEGRVPFMNIFDGFRTSHEVSKIELLDDATLNDLIDEDCVAAFRERALTPDRPVIRGTAQNPDVFFQAREGCNTFYDKLPDLVQSKFDQFAKLTGRQYKLFDYVGDPQANRVIIAMGSGAETAEETAKALNAQGEKVGVLKVRLYRPFSLKHFVEVLPATVRSIAVLDRTKEPGAIGEPLLQEIITAMHEARATGTSKLEVDPIIIGGRYGLSSKEFTPAMVKAIFDELKKDAPQRRFTVGINDDVTGLSLDYDETFSIESDDVVRAVFYGLGSDGTVGANKNSIKIIGEGTDNYAQGYFVYDSKKSGAVTISHLRFGPEKICAPYLITEANFVACHQDQFLDQYDMLEAAAPGAVFLLNTIHGPGEAWSHLPREVQSAIIEKNLKCYVIDAYKVARETGMGGRINTIMQTCFFAISGVLPREEAIAKIKEAIKKTYGRKGDEIVQKNYHAVDSAIAAMHEMTHPAALNGALPMPPIVSEAAPDFVQQVTATILKGKGDQLPVSAFPVDGTWPTDTARWEKRNIAQEIPAWEPDICIQCNKCVMACPHSAIRAKFYPQDALSKAPETFKSNTFRSRDFPDSAFTIQVAPEDCTGCNLCVNVCPAKDKANPSRKAINMTPQEPLRDAERENYEFFLDLPNPDRTALKPLVKDTQFAQPLFEYSGACAGCGETPYIKLVTQLFGDRMVVANATGCSSIYGGNLPTTPYAVNAEGRGPAWSNSLFEDNAEYGFGQRFALDRHAAFARELLVRLRGRVGEMLVSQILSADQSGVEGIAAQRARVADLKARLAEIGAEAPDAKRLLSVADYLVDKSVWIVGGDGWAYDIGFGGLDHVMYLNRNVNILVLDTEVYSNTGGQSSKSTPLGATAKFAVSGKSSGKKDLGEIAMSYGHVYVARVAMGAKDSQTVKALAEAEAYPGTSIVIAYTHCIAHGYNMAHGFDQQKRAVDSGTWLLYRYDPRLAGTKPPLQLDCAKPKLPLSEYLDNELRFRMLQKTNPERYKELKKSATEFCHQRYNHYEQLAGITELGPDGDEEKSESTEGKTAKG